MNPQRAENLPGTWQTGGKCDESHWLCSPPFEFDSKIRGSLNVNFLYAGLHAQRKTKLQWYSTTSKKSNTLQ